MIEQTAPTFFGYNSGPDHPSAPAPSVASNGHRIHAKQTRHILDNAMTQLGHFYAPHTVIYPSRIELQTEMKGTDAPYSIQIAV